MLLIIILQLNSIYLDMRGIDVTLLVVVLGRESDPIIIIAHHILIPAQIAQISCDSSEF